MQDIRYAVVALNLSPLCFSCFSPSIQGRKKMLLSEHRVQESQQQENAHYVADSGSE